MNTFHDFLDRKFLPIAFYHTAIEAVPTSPMGHKRTLAHVGIMSALPPKADIG
jgi:hypothetical protein